MPLKYGAPHASKNISDPGRRVRSLAIAAAPRGPSVAPVAPVAAQPPGFAAKKAELSGPFRPKAVPSRVDPTQVSFKATGSLLRGRTLVLERDHGPDVLIKLRGHSEQSAGALSRFLNLQAAKAVQAGKRVEIDESAIARGHPEYLFKGLDAHPMLRNVRPEQVRFAIGSDNHHPSLHVHVDGLEVGRLGYHSDYHVEHRGRDGVGIGPFTRANLEQLKEQFEFKLAAAEGKATLDFQRARTEGPAGLVVTAVPITMPHVEPPRPHRSLDPKRGELPSWLLRK